MERICLDVNVSCGVWGHSEGQADHLHGQAELQDFGMDFIRRTVNSTANSAGVALSKFVWQRFFDIWTASPIRSSCLEF